MFSLATNSTGTNTDIIMNVIVVNVLHVSPGKNGILNLVQEKGCIYQSST